MQARQVVVYAHDEARLLNHGYIGTEHLLLGLMREPESLAAHTLEAFDVLLEEARAQVVRIVGRGEQIRDEHRQIPLTPGAKKVLEQSMREAIAGNGPAIETEHLLLALLSISDSVAVKVLREFDLSPDQVRDEVAQQLNAREPPPPPPPNLLAWVTSAARPAGGESSRTTAAVCSFCRRRADQVPQLVAGPFPDVAICDDCVRHVNGILRRNQGAD